MAAKTIFTQVNSTIASSLQLEDQYIIQNPICKKNFELLPQIYGRSKRKSKKMEHISSKYSRIQTISLPKIQVQSSVQQNSLKGVSRYLFAGKNHKKIENLKRSYSIQYSPTNSQQKRPSFSINIKNNSNANLNISKNVDVPTFELDNFKNSLTQRNKINKFRLDQSIQIINSKNKLNNISQQNDEFINAHMKKIKLKALSKNIIPEMKQIKISNDAIIKKCQIKLSNFEQIKQQNEQYYSQSRSPSKSVQAQDQLTQLNIAATKNVKLNQFNLKIQMLQNQSSAKNTEKQTMFYSIQKRYQSLLNTCKDSKASSRIDGTYTNFPTKQQYKQFILKYKPINKQFNLYEISQKATFSVIVKNKSIYFGEINELKQKHGLGLTLFQNSLFQGEYLNNLKINGCQKNKQGTYIGSYKDGQRSGHGQFIWANGQFFKGQWLNGRKDGFGIWRSPQGYSYEGQWFENRQEGQGIFKHSMSIYKGQFINFLKHGHGEEVFKNGDKYVGQYKNGRPSGKGRYQWKNGASYQGDFKEGKRDGFGIQVDENGNFYKGQFKEDVKRVDCPQKNEKLQTT